MKKEQIAVFCGCDSQVGTTMISLSTAQYLAAKGKRVLFITSESAQELIFAPVKGNGTVMELAGRMMDEKTLEPADFDAVLMEYQGLEILPGMRNWNGLPSEGAWILEEIIRTALQTRDYVIIDAGCAAEKGLGKEALSEAGKVFLIATQQEKTLRRWEMRSRWIKERICTEPFFLINKYNASGAFFSESQMADLLGCEKEKLLTVSYVPFGWQAETEHTTLLKFRKFRKEICRTADCIMDSRKGDESHDSRNRGEI